MAKTSKDKEVRALMKKAKEEMQQKLQEHEDKKPKRKYLTAKEQYKKIREDLKPKVKEVSSEESLIAELFNVDEIPIIEKITEENTKVDSSLWDFTLEDDVEFFDPLMSYELTKYRPINKTEGLDFNPD